MIGAIKILLRPFCRHKYMPYQYIDAPEGAGRYRRRRIWKCTRCGRERMKVHDIPIICIIEHKIFGIHSPSNSCNCPLFLRKRKQCENCIGRAEVQIKMQEEIGDAIMKGFEDGVKNAKKIKIDIPKMDEMSR